LRADPAHLRQILVNLIGNAVKYTPAGGVGVRAKLVTANTAKGGVPWRTASDARTKSSSPDPHRAWIALQVVDSGVGIAPTDHARIFEEFEQVNAGPRGDSMQRGTGLGLSISRRLAQLLGGEIGVESELGKGSTFTLWLPVHPADLEPARAAAPPAAERVG
ncbi:MAG: ATP-binding protein, partial [Gemmatimonadaceae bacterium]